MCYKLTNSLPLHFMLIVTYDIDVETNKFVVDKCSLGSTCVLCKILHLVICDAHSTSSTFALIRVDFSYCNEVLAGLMDVSLDALVCFPHVISWSSQPAWDPYHL